MSRCIVKQSLAQPVAVAPVTSVSVCPVTVPVTVSTGTITAVQPAADATGLFTKKPGCSDCDVVFRGLFAMLFRVKHRKIDGMAIRDRICTR